MQATTSRQRIESALDTWSQAELQQVGVVSDRYGTVELLHASVTQIEPTLALSLKRDAVKALVDKIQAKVQGWAPAPDQEAAKHLLMKLPSLGRFAASGKLGNLRQEWEALKQYQAEKLESDANQRKRIFSEFRDLLPDMPLQFEPDGTAVLFRDFSAPKHQALILAEIEHVNTYQLNRHGFYNSFTSDLPRTCWKIEANGQMQEFGLQHEEEKLRALKEVFDHKEAALATASKVMNQVACAMVLNANLTISPMRSGVVMQSTKKNTEICNFRVMKNKGNIELEINMFKKIETIVVPASDENQNSSIWRVNEYDFPSGNSALSNFGEHIRLNFLIDTEAALEGRLIPVKDTMVQASIEYRLRPTLNTAK